ncbi:hypothetical protein PGIGA_G00253780 [Pangasianodon gigas]|uniref:Uncharacterized protein n=1 Tax=Pangasianodon gigas TaxID=30993 RepID=A0ACC5WSB5_PANGG|nr:hypothetical protein [Pangasianodon gigas]
MAEQRSGYRQLANEEETETPEVPQQGTDAPPPYTSVGADTAFFDYKDDGNYPKPPSYNVATSLPSYDEAERTKAESSVPLMPTRDEDFVARDDFDDVDQLRVGNDGIFMLTFFMAFLFNWIGFFLSFCLTTSAAGRYGAVSGFGLSLVKWVLIVRFSTYFPGYFDGQYWLCSPHIFRVILMGSTGCGGYFWLSDSCCLSEVSLITLECATWLIIPSQPFLAPESFLSTEDFASQDYYEIRKMAKFSFESSENSAKQKPPQQNCK